MSALDDIVIVIEWLVASKTATGQVAEALERLRNRSRAAEQKTTVTLPEGSDDFRRRHRPSEYIEGDAGNDDQGDIG